MANDFALWVGEFGRYSPPTIYQLCVSVRDQKENIHFMPPIENDCTNKNILCKDSENVLFYLPNIPTWEVLLNVPGLYQNLDVLV